MGMKEKQTAPASGPENRTPEERVRAMEVCFDAVRAVLGEDPARLLVPGPAAEQLQRLRDYSESGLWLRDWERDERGERHPGHVVQEHYPLWPGDAATHTMTREEFAEKFEKLGMNEFHVANIRRIDVDATWPERIDTEGLIARIRDALQEGTEA